jgi:hypothetical protein
LLSMRGTRRQQDSGDKGDKSGLHGHGKTALT